MSVKGMGNDYSPDEHSPDNPSRLAGASTLRSICYGGRAAPGRRSQASTTQWAHPKVMLG